VLTTATSNKSPKRGGHLWFYSSPLLEANHQNLAVTIHFLTTTPANQSPKQCDHLCGGHHHFCPENLLPRAS